MGNTSCFTVVDATMTSHLSWDYEPYDTDPEGWYHIYDMDTWATDPGNVLGHYGARWSFSIKTPRTEEMDRIVSRFVNDLDRYIERTVRRTSE
jgi:hypothetical protein